MLYILFLGYWGNVLWRIALDIGVMYSGELHIRDIYKGRSSHALLPFFTVW